MVVLRGGLGDVMHYMQKAPHETSPEPSRNICLNPQREVDALKPPCSSEIHAEAQKKDLFQKASYFHHQITKKGEVEDNALEEAFSTAYF